MTHSQCASKDMVDPHSRLCGGFVFDLIHDPYHLPDINAVMSLHSLPLKSVRRNLALRLRLLIKLLRYFRSCADHG